MKIVEIDWNRAASFLVSIIYLLVAYRAGGGEAVMRTTIFLVFPIAGIWFSEPLSENIKTTTATAPPATAVRVASWILLFSPVMAMLIIGANK